MYNKNMLYNWPIKPIKLGDVLLNTDNIRLDVSGKVTQDLLIADLFNNENAMELVLSVANSGVFPDELPVVIEQDHNYVVIEGNRRIAALKAIKQPDEAPKYYANKIKQIGSLPAIENINVVLAPSREDVRKLIANKHTKNTRKRWQPLRQAYFYKTLLDSTKEKWTIERLQEEFAVQDVPRFIKMLEMHKIAKSLKYRTDEIDAKVHDERNFPITTLERVYDSQKAQEFLGFNFETNGEVKISATKNEFEKVFQRIVQDIAMNNVDSRSLNKESGIENYLQSIVEKPVEKTKSVTTTKAFYERKAATKPTPATRSIKQPKGVIPNYVAFRLKSSVLLDMYNELRTIPVKDFPNAAHDLLRSFLECSLAEYLKEAGDYDKVKSHGQHPKLGEMLDHLIDTKAINDSNVIQAIKGIKSDWNKPYSLERMNMVNHNENYTTTEKDVRAAWGKLEKLMILILNPSDEK